MLSLLTTIALAGPAVPFGGLDWKPLGRSDLVWEGDTRSTGVLVGPFDGFLDPNLSAYGGVWLHPRLGLAGSLGVARVQNTSQTGDVQATRLWQSVRPELTLRWRLVPPTAQRPSVWVSLSGHAALATVRDRSNAYSKKEQTQADENAQREQAALTGGGGSFGAGMAYPLTEQLSVGGYYRFIYQRSATSADDATDLTSWVSAQAGFLFELTGLRSGQDNPPVAGD